ncbi:MAG: hypothetical protein LBT12_08665 [Oscillospiraceae bacterium]|jgi:hypothetical protein|nr:hypothetical protein [Oscillospiraceae bacterium]
MSEPEKRYIYTDEEIERMSADLAWKTAIAAAVTWGVSLFCLVNVYPSMVLFGPFMLIPPIILLVLAYLCLRLAYAALLYSEAGSRRKKVITVVLCLVLAAFLFHVGMNFTVTPRADRKIMAQMTEIAAYFEAHRDEIETARLAETDGEGQYRMEFESDLSYYLMYNPTLVYSIGHQAVTSKKEYTYRIDENWYIEVEFRHAI